MKIALSRALLQRPEVLLLHGMADGLEENEVEELFRLLRGWMAGDVQAQPAADDAEVDPDALPLARTVERSVVFVGTERTMQCAEASGALTHVLLIETASRGTLYEIGAAREAATAPVRTNPSRGLSGFFTAPSAAADATRGEFEA